MLPGSPGWQLHPSRGWAREGDRPAEGTGTTPLPAVLRAARRLSLGALEPSKIILSHPHLPGPLRMPGTASLPGPWAIFGTDPLSRVQNTQVLAGQGWRWGRCYFQG